MHQLESHLQERHSSREWHATRAQQVRAASQVQSCVCVYVCGYACVYVCVCACACVHLWLWLCLCLCLFLGLCLCLRLISVFVSVCTRHWFSFWVDKNKTQSRRMGQRARLQRDNLCILWKIYNYKKNTSKIWELKIENKSTIKSGRWGECAAGARRANGRCSIAARTSSSWGCVRVWTCVYVCLRARWREGILAQQEHLRRYFVSVCLCVCVCVWESI